MIWSRSPYIVDATPTSERPKGARRGHQTTKKLIDENQVIYLETLAVKNMMKNHCLAGAIADCSWFELTRQLEYKAAWYGRTVVKIDRFFPSSKMCSGCHFIKQDMKLSDREWVCPECGMKHDRDHNAAKMILLQGRKTTGGTPESKARRENKLRELSLGSG